MTDASDRTSSTTAELETITNVADVNNAPDHALMLLVDLINQIVGIEIGITLHCNGMIISGLLTSGHRYTSEVARTLREITGEHQPIADAFAGMIEDLGAIYPSKFVSSGDDDDQDGDREDPVTSVRTAYIHLRKVSVYSPTSVTPVAFSVWRGRLSAVAGWSLGEATTI